MVQKFERQPGLAGRWFKGGAICLLMATASSWAVEDKPAAAVGLRGLIPAKAPAGLQAEDFELLNGNWAAWGTSTNELIEKLYSDDPLDIAAQRDLLAQLKSKASVMQAALNDTAYTQLHGPLADLHGRLVRRVEFGTAILNILESDPEVAHKAVIGNSFAQLKSAISSVRSDLASFQGGDQWLPYLALDSIENAAKASDNSPATLELFSKIATKLTPVPEWTEAQKTFLARPSLARLNTELSATVKVISAPVAADPRAKVRELAGVFLTSLDEYENTGSTAAATNTRVAYAELKNVAPDGGSQLSELMRAHYYNYNLRVITSEGMLRRVMGDSRNESAWINQCIMGAQINGSQCTNSTVSVDLRPSGDRAYIALTVDGTVRSNTTGSTDQATVFANGYHNFHAEKGIFFDGHTISSTPTSVGVSANNQIYAAQSNMSGVPLLGRIADGIALGVAQGKAGEANAYTADQIRNEVGPRLDTESQSKFDKANLELETRVWGPLREQGMYPDTMNWSSTDREALVRSRLMKTDELGGASPAPNLSIPSDGLLIQVHESLMSNGADRFDLAGKTMTESEVRKMLKERLTKLLGKEVDIPDPVVPEGEQPVNNTLVFDSVDPVRFQVEGGQVKFIMRAGLKPQNGDEIPTQIITVPLSFRVEGNQVMLERGNVSVKPITPVDNPGLQITRGGVMRQNIQRAMPNKALKGEFDREIQGKMVHLKIIGIDARDGWLSIQAR